ncbi:MAG: flagellin lysine-N-methylase [Oscillospiraceae bacterium]|nr:flagellin lysine-N-methylase [Oscillospiraceae bacterium]
MKIFAPDYYGDFKCIAGSCKHSCCKGWEIDIDEETAEYYKTVPGEFGKRLCANISFDDECSSFLLKEDERCPFHNEKGLCDIILTLGEEALCQVCDDHPRFRNFFEHRTEVGLGLCCEAAAKLVLEKETETKITEIADDGGFYEETEEEKAMFAERQRLFDIFQDRNLSIEERIEKALYENGAFFPKKDFSAWADIFLCLERLDEKWTEILLLMKEKPAPSKDFDSIAAEQLLCYFTFRHYSNMEKAEAVKFIVLCFLITEKAAEQVGIFEAARLFSSEIEYSDENIEALLDELCAERT